MSGADSLASCLSHPYMVQLHYRLRHLLQPATFQADMIGEPGDACAAAAKQLQGLGWGFAHEALLCRCFLEFFREALQG